MGRKTRKVALLFGVALASLAPVSCTPGKFVPSKSNEAWKGPPVWVESTSDWTVVAEPPIGGWRINLVQIMETLGHNEVFITLQPPNPTFIVTPVAVQQRIATSIPNSTPIWVYARQMNWKGEPASGPFMLAAKSQDAKPPTPPPEKAEGQTSK
ncbi:MAG: hypothetical protein U0573_00790 [Phycisphaerales bacterium]